MVIEEPLDDAAQPLPLYGNRLMTPFAELLLDLVGLCDQPLLDRLPADDDERTRAVARAGVGET